MGINAVPQTSNSPDLDPCDIWLFPNLKEKFRGFRYERIEEMKEAVTKVIDMFTKEDFHGGLPEVVGTAQQVHCSWKRLLRRGQEFHECTINNLVRRQLHMNAASNLEQFLAATPHKTPTVRPPASYHENYAS